MPRDVYNYYGVSEQAKVSKHRLEDARCLFDAGHWRGAMYLAGYSVECLLKTKLMQMYSCRHLRKLEVELQTRGMLPSTGTVFTHQLEALLRLTGRMDQLRRDQALWRTFYRVNRWLPAWRYSANLSTRKDSESFLNDVSKVRQWIENNT